MEVELFFNTILSLLACASIILTHYPKGLHIMLCLIDAVYVSIALFVKAQSAGIVFWHQSINYGGCDAAFKEELHSMPIFGVTGILWKPD